MVEHVLIDPRSGPNIIFFSTFQQIDILDANVRPSNINMAGFIGSKTLATGQMSLMVSADPYNLLRILFSWIPLHHTMQYWDVRSYPNSKLVHPYSTRFFVTLSLMRCEK